MERRPDKVRLRRRVRYRYRDKVSGTGEVPRLAVFRSLKHIYVQAIDDLRSTTLVAASSRDKEFSAGKGSGANIAGAKRVGELIAERLKVKGLSRVVFDRGGHRYHGRVQAVAEAIRAGGIQI